MWAMKVQGPKQLGWTGSETLEIVDAGPKSMHDLNFEYEKRTPGILWVRTGSYFQVAS